MNETPDQRPPEDQAGHMASGLTEFSLRRRITVLVLLMSIVVVGVVATVGIPVELFPRGFTGQSLRSLFPGKTRQPRRCSTRSRCRWKKN